MDEALQQFKATYIAECFELLEDMEQRLMALDHSDASSEDLNAIFRCAHSIKGGAGAFGLDAIARFTHRLEALLDLMREGTLEVSSQAINLLLEAGDAVTQMVRAADENTPIADDFAEAIALRMDALAGLTMQEAAPSALPSNPMAGAMRFYHLHFIPQRDMIASGNEPLLLLRELASLGTMQAKCDASALPAFEDLETDQCYLSWHITLQSDHSEARLREVFEFVEDACELSITQSPDETSQSQQAAPNHAKSDAPAPVSPSKAAPAATSIRVDIDKIDALINMVGEVVITQSCIAAQSAQLRGAQHHLLRRSVDEMMQHIRELQHAVMAIRMQPVKSVFSRMPRLVRDLSGQLGKSVTLHMQGEETEVDKTIIEQLADPLTHMIRNCVDHGIEMPEKRRAVGKPEQGTIRLSAAHRGGRIIIEIRDDGGGINREKVRAKAIEKGILSAQDTPSDEEIDHLIFAAGFSTADQVSSISGRGVGMDVVRRNIEQIGGTVSLHNQPGEGSHFSISLPLTLAILDGMIVRCGSEHYIIPISQMIESLRPHPQDIQALAGGKSILNLRGQFAPVLYLHELLAIEDAQPDASKAIVMLLEYGAQPIALVVDELIGQQQVVIKSLEANATPIEGISGATILGDGQVALILDIAALHDLSRRARPEMKQIAATPCESVAA